MRSPPRRTPSDPGSRRVQSEVSSPRQTPIDVSTPRRAPSDASAARTSPREEDSGDEELRAKLDVYLIGQKFSDRGINQSTRSFLSTSQRLAEQMFGVRTTYTINSQGGSAKWLMVSDGKGVDPTEEPAGPRVEQVEPVSLSTARAEGQERKVPKLRLEYVRPEAGNADRFSPHSRPQTARFATITRPGTLRVDTVRLTELASRPASASWSRPRVYEPPLQQHNPSLRRNFDQLERAWLRQSTIVQCAKTRAGCRSMSRGFSLLPQPSADGNKALALGSVHAPTEPIRTAKMQTKSAPNGHMRTQKEPTSSTEQCVAPDDVEEIIMGRRLWPLGKDEEFCCEDEKCMASPLEAGRSKSGSEVLCVACMQLYLFHVFWIAQPVDVCGCLPASSIKH